MRRPFPLLPQWNFIAGNAFDTHEREKGKRGAHVMGRYLLLWLLGIPLPILLLIWIIGGLH